MSDLSGFGKLVPGFDFLQNLAKSAGSALPGIGQWVAPTLDPAELEKRISELRTVQYWLEQNARMLAATIQALEVQKMTLSTLKTMNVTVGDLGNAMKLRAPASTGTDHPVRPAAKAARAEKAADAPGVVDPMQWWGALTQQFTQLAVQAMKEGTADAAKQLAGTVTKQSLGAAGKTLKKAAGVPAAVARTARDAVQGVAKPPRRSAKQLPT
ncbi:MAG TPA: PhaM family polyhydroxyalkanoate granule multifunctional regulatory protein [Burkholderiaceae bacterium]|nr:PhaM family polyhydroxyalkanoate granule multifunctional regulatory protein [Burkholderiaceae bacterium]